MHWQINFHPLERITDFPSVSSGQEEVPRTMRLETDGTTVTLGVGNPVFSELWEEESNIFQVHCTCEDAMLCAADAHKPFPNTIDINDSSPVTEIGYNFSKNVKRL